MDTYLSKLKEGGILVFHISNRYLDLKPVVANLARDAGLSCLVQTDLAKPGDRELLKYSSIWVVMARRPQDLGPLAASPSWQELKGNNDPLWTDDFSNILTVITWQPFTFQENLGILSGKKIR
jgi:hypothetical protein